MMSQKEIRRRIDAVRNTQKITRSMKLVAAAKLRGAQRTAVQARPFTSALYDMATRVSRRLGRRAPELWRRPRSLNCIDLVLITSDRGLCGGFNENLLREVEEGIVEHTTHHIDVKLFVAGRQGVKWLDARGYDVEEIAHPEGREAALDHLCSTLTDRCASGESAGCNIGFNRFVSAARQKVTFWNLLPLSHRGIGSEHNLEYIYEPDREGALRELACLSVRSSIVQAMLESEASEHAARMTAMDAATRNADDMISHLRSVYNRVRQESITEELLDIINGAEALKAG